MANARAAVIGLTDAAERPRTVMIERVRPLFAWIVFPGVMGGAIALTIVAMWRGLTPIAAMAIGQGVGVGIVALCERVFPYVGTPVQLYMRVRA